MKGLIFYSYKMKAWLIRIISVLAVIVTLMVGIYCSNKLLVNKWSHKQYDPFFENDQVFDVLFFGSSHVNYGVSPLDLYQNYGITSYNLSMSGNYIASDFYCLQEILDFLKEEERQLPKVVVVDVFPDEQTIGRLHFRWDDFPISTNKAKMAGDLAKKEDQPALLYPFLLYHNRWNELTKDDFQVETNQFYGLRIDSDITNNGSQVDITSYGLAYPDKEIITDPLDQATVHAAIVDYLRQITVACEELDIQLVLIQIPYSYRPDLQRVVNGIFQYAKEQGILCVNYMNEITEIDYDIDFFDTGHLNPGGMRIMTDELGKLLSTIGLEDHRRNPEAEQWDQAYEEYIRFRSEKLKEINDAKTYLMAINDPDLISTVQIYKGILGDIQVSKLIERLKEAGHQIVITEERPEIVSQEGQDKEYDVYCEVYRRDDAGMGMIHSIGFTL